MADSSLLQGTLELLVLETFSRARYYMLTAGGDNQLAIERAEFERSAGAVFQVLDCPGGTA